MRKEAPAYGTVGYSNMREKELWPRDYVAKIRKTMGIFVARGVGGGRLSKAQVGALALMDVLERRRFELERERNPEELRLEMAAKIAWVENRIERVGENPNYQAAVQPIRK